LTGGGGIESDFAVLAFPGFKHALVHQRAQLTPDGSAFAHTARRRRKLTPPLALLQFDSILTQEPPVLKAITSWQALGSGMGAGADMKTHAALRLRPVLRGVSAAHEDQAKVLAG
jgi:hypothetical protein